MHIGNTYLIHIINFEDNSEIIFLISQQKHILGFGNFHKVCENSTGLFFQNRYSALHMVYINKSPTES